MKTAILFHFSFTILIGVLSCSIQLKAAEKKDGDIFSRTSVFIQGGLIRAHVEVLADDKMEGRETGTDGFLLAAEYVASKFTEIGLTPLGESQTYYQNINFLETRLIAGTSAISLHKGSHHAPLVEGVDFAQPGGYGEPNATVTAPVAFAGFGIIATEYGHDDYADIDVKGKIVVVLTGAPPNFSTDERAFYSSTNNKRALAAKLGAVGIMTVRTPVDQRRIPWARVVRSLGAAGMRWLDSNDVPQGGFPELKGDTALSEAGAEKLFGLAERDLSLLFERHINGEASSFDLGISATISRRARHRRTSSVNVLAILPGSDLNLRDEFVLYTAHLDHLGVDESMKGDNIFNGAYDNAAGVAIMLEVAAAMAQSEKKPRRSIIFAALTGEEKGLQGSEFLAHNPPVPIESIVANINIDMPYIGFPIADVEGLGAGHSTLQASLENAASKNSLISTPDPRPELVRLIRSDQFSFVKKGVPALNLKPGSKAMTTETDSVQALNDFLQNHYHAPTDDLDLPFNLESAEKLAKVALALGLNIANDDIPPQWHKSDFFGDRFGRRRNKDN